MSRNVYHVTLPVVQYVVMRVESHPDADTDDLAVQAYAAWKRGDDAVCHLAPQAEWDGASVELVEDNAPQELEWDDTNRYAPEDGPEAA